MLSMSEKPITDSNLKSLEDVDNLSLDPPGIVLWYIDCDIHVAPAFGSWFESNPSHCAATLGKLFIPYWLCTYNSSIHESLYMHLQPCNNNINNIHMIEE